MIGYHQRRRLKHLAMWASAIICTLNLSALWLGLWYYAVTGSMPFVADMGLAILLLFTTSLITGAIAGLFRQP